jgi:hypothetical protein
MNPNRIRVMAAGRPGGGFHHAEIGAHVPAGVGRNAGTKSSCEYMCGTTSSAHLQVSGAVIPACGPQLTPTGAPTRHTRVVSRSERRPHYFPSLVGGFLFLEVIYAGHRKVNDAVSRVNFKGRELAIRAHRVERYRCTS